MSQFSDTPGPSLMKALQALSSIGIETPEKPPLHYTMEELDAFHRNRDAAEAVAECKRLLRAVVVNRVCYEIK